MSFFSFYFHSHYLNRMQPCVYKKHKATIERKICLNMHLIEILAILVALSHPTLSPSRNMNAHYPILSFPLKTYRHTLFCMCRMPPICKIMISVTLLLKLLCMSAHTCCSSCYDTLTQSICRHTFKFRSIHLAVKDQP